MPFKNTNIRTLEEIQANPDPNNQDEIGYANTAAELEAEKLLQRIPHNSPDFTARVVAAASAQAQANKGLRSRDDTGKFIKVDDKSLFDAEDKKD